jgi:hypothetical protein
MVEAGLSAQGKRMILSQPVLSVNVDLLLIMQAMESFVTQVMPVRAALQLRESTLLAQKATGDAHYQLLEEHLPQPQHQQPLAAASGEADSSASALGAATASNHNSSNRQQVAQQLQQHQSLAWHGIGKLLTFKEPQLEVLYRTAACRQWQRQLDALFVVWAMMSMLGSQLVTGLSGSAVLDTMLGLLLLLLALGSLKQLQVQPTRQYMVYRQAVIAALRLIHTAVFCWRLWTLPTAAHGHGHSSAAAENHSLLSAGAWSQAETAACGVLLMQGLTGLLQPPMHAVVQLLSATAILGTLWHVSRVTNIAMQAQQLGVLLLLGLALPVATAIMIEWQCRLAFLRKIR